MLDTLLNAVLPIFAVVAVGFAMARLRVVDGGIARAINRFVFLVAVPVLLFRLIGGSSIHAFDWSVLAGYLAAELAVYGAGFLVARLGFGYSRRESLLIGMTVAFSNHVFFVLPIARLVHGEAAAVVVAAIITVDAVLVYGLTVMAMDVLSGREAGRGPLATLGRIARNPQILAIAAGLAFSLSGLPLTGGLDVFTGFVGAAAAPAALFTLGIVLSAPGEPAAGRSDWAMPAVAALMRLAAMPLLAWAIIQGWLASDPLWAAPALLVAAGPSGAMPMVIGLQYGVRTTAVARAVLLSTLGALVTLSVVAGL